MQLSAMAQLAEDFEHLAFQGMVGAGYPHLAGQVSEVGSVSKVLSTALIGRNCSNWWTHGWEMEWC
jgi:hypothetical protein